LFLAVNCAAIPENLLENQLFGHRKGAFTGADKDRDGMFVHAGAGTVFLDEIGEAPLAIQAKLLRAIEQKEVMPVGANEPVTVEARILAATNKDLKKEVEAGRFREDLYYRLAVVPMTLPPLRERGGDVVQLVEFFLERAAQRLERVRVALSEDAGDLLARYRWPGNVRELENLITRACVLSAGGTIAADDLSPWLEPNAMVASGGARAQSAAATPELAGARLDDLERATIVATLQKFDGNRAQTAAALGIGVRTLSGKLRAYGYAPRAREFSLPPSDEPDRGDRQKLPMPSAVNAGWTTRRSA
jgi:transcriptional regulator with GAF, ATPase, and Fis domain